MEQPVLPQWAPFALAALAFASIAWLERVRPLRSARASKPRRVLRNFACFAMSAVPAGLQALALVPLMAWLEREHVGLLHVVELPGWMELVCGVLLLDATLWIWHWGNHVVPLLWRFHLVHHADLDLDASTALRFHFGEMALSVPYRLAQVVSIGVVPSTLSLWSALLLISILFHHGNVRLPLQLERALVPFVVTPRMHGIHHSTVRAERNTNYASLFTVWDRLFGTLLLAVPQAVVRIGVPPFDSEAELSLKRITTLPFRRAGRSGLRESAEPARLVARATQLVE